PRLFPNPANFHDSGLLPAAFPHATDLKTGRRLSSLRPLRFRHTLVAPTLSRVWHGKARSQRRPRRLSATGPSPGARQTRATWKALPRKGARLPHSKEARLLLPRPPLWQSFERPDWHATARPLATLSQT